jgi:hypothetical protein
LVRSIERPYRGPFPARAAAQYVVHLGDELLGHRVAVDRVRRRDDLVDGEDRTPALDPAADGGPRAGIRLPDHRGDRAGVSHRVGLVGGLDVLAGQAEVGGDPPGDCGLARRRIGPLDLVDDRRRGRLVGEDLDTHVVAVVA